MLNIRILKCLAAAGACFAALTATASATQFDIPRGDLKGALAAYAAQTGTSLVYVSSMVQGVQTHGVHGDLQPDAALAHILQGTGFVTRRYPSGAIGIDRETSDNLPSMTVATSAAPTVSGAALETVTVTSSKIGGDVQNIPISITALSQEQLTATQTAGGPDLIKQVPNMTFTKTNFSGYSIQIRGIGTQAISVTTDPAVAVAFNDMPFIRNHFFEQEFYDVSQVQVLRGPQGTLYGRNATAGVVNLSSAKPTDQFEAMASLEMGNYGERRPEGMINIPIVDDRLDIRIAGEWTKRQGYSFNEITGNRIDGRDLWSARATIGWKPFENLQTYLVWEHFSENDDRLRSGKQLCKRDPGPDTIDGIPVDDIEFEGVISYRNEFSQGCLPVSLYAPDAFQVPNGRSLPYVAALYTIGMLNNTDPYTSAVQSANLRVVESTLNPIYKSKNDTVEWNADYRVTQGLILSSQTGFNQDSLFSTEDYNRFNTASGVFAPSQPFGEGTFPSRSQVSDSGVFCDPQLGCTDRFVGEDLSQEHAWQLSQEFRLASSFTGPFNFSFGVNYLHYETEENYYVFINALTLLASLISQQHLSLYVPGITDNTECLKSLSLPPGSTSVFTCDYMDPNPVSRLNGDGHNYFLSQNPYVLNSYAGFGEVYYQIASELKLIGGLRWTDDQKHFVLIPSQVLTGGWGYPITGAVDQQWDEWTGRFAVNWTPKLQFSDQTLVYGSYAHGYKAGGANPPGAVLLSIGFNDNAHPVHPLTFEPEFVDAFEVGTKNTFLDGALTLNGNVFYYNYENYQISYIVDRTSVNLNFDAHVKGAEVEAAWEPVPGLRFNFAGGWEDTALAKGSQAIDLMDRTAGHSGWTVLKPAVTQASDCILPTYVAAAGLLHTLYGFTACGDAYNADLDPITQLPYKANPDPVYLPGYPGFDPTTAPNNGEGFFKDLSGNKLPNAPPFTVSFGGQYSVPLSSVWAGTLRGDFYWQDNSWARVFNDNPYDRLHGYANLNLALIFANQAGWQVMLYDKNVFDTTAITGDFLNSDDSGLTTNVFLTDPKLIGIRVTKNW